jgi:hypothetical protein
MTLLTAKCKHHALRRSDLALRACLALRNLGSFEGSFSLAPSGRKSLDRWRRTSFKNVMASAILMLRAGISPATRAASAFEAHAARVVARERIVMKKMPKKITLNRETLRLLDRTDLLKAGGGASLACTAKTCDVCTGRTEYC